MLKNIRLNLLIPSWWIIRVVGGALCPKRVLSRVQHCCFMDVIIVDVIRNSEVPEYKNSKQVFILY